MGNIQVYGMSMNCVTVRTLELKWQKPNTSYLKLQGAFCPREPNSGNSGGRVGPVSVSPHISIQLLSFLFILQHQLSPRGWNHIYKVPQNFVCRISWLMRKKSYSPLISVRKIPAKFLIVFSCIIYFSVARVTFWLKYHPNQPDGGSKRIPISSSSKRRKRDVGLTITASVYYKQKPD